MDKKTVTPDKLEPLRNETSTLAIHEEDMRETADPYEANRRGPRWFYAFTMVALLIGTFYLGRHMGKLDATAHIGFLERSVPSQGTAKQSAPGSDIFQQRCSTCHQADGKGIPGAFPPLVQSAYVLGDKERLLKIILHGLTGPLEVEGKSFNGMMPAWGTLMSDAEIAAVASYIREGLGENNAGKVSEEEVRTLRKRFEHRDKPWTVNELEGKS